MSITILQLHKRDSGEYKFIQDKYAFNSSNKTFALSDGTTQSFKSEIWAELLTTSFVNNPTFETKKLVANFVSCVENYKSIDFKLSSNPAKASLEKAKLLKGGTATFIGVQFSENNKLDVISCGDSNLFILNKKRKIKSFPFNDLESLDNNIDFLNTEQLIIDNVNESLFHQRTMEVQFGEKLILATDALSRLILHKPEVLKELTQLNDFDSFHEFCLKFWKRKELQEDDISAIIINVDNTNRKKIIHPPIDFTFPKVKEEEFIPTPVTQKTSTKFTKMQMQEIRNQFNGVANDFYEVKKKIKLLIVLLISIVSLLLVCIIFIFWFRPNTGHQGLQINTSKNTTTKTLEKRNRILKSEIKSLKKQLRNQTSLNQEPTKSNQNEEVKAKEKISIQVAKERQEELKSAGYEIIVDGKWGENSKQVWRKYQETKAQ